MSVNIAFWKLGTLLLALQRGAILTKTKVNGLVANIFRRPTNIFVNAGNRLSIGKKQKNCKGEKTFKGERAFKGERVKG